MDTAQILSALAENTSTSTLHKMRAQLTATAGRDAAQDETLRCVTAELAVRRAMSLHCEALRMAAVIGTRPGFIGYNVAVRQAARPLQNA